MLRFAAALLVGWAAAGLVATLLAVLNGALVPWISGVAWLAAAAAGVLAAKACARAPAGLDLRAADGIALGLLAVVCLRQFLFLTFERDGSILALLPYNYGDLPLHWSYVEYLAQGVPFWPDNPIFTGQRLHYPIGVDLVTALAVQLGVSVRVALAGLGLMGSALLGVTLLAWGRGFAIVAFLFSGGLVGWDAIRSALERDPHGTLAWKSLFLALFMPQRGFLFALPAGLLLLWSFRERLVREKPGLPAWVEGLLWGGLPLYHAHTFLFVSIVVAVWALAQRRVRDVLPALLVAIPPALFTTWQVTEGLHAASIVWWKAGWVMSGNPLLFLAVNFGAFLPLLLWAAVDSWKAGKREARLLVWPGLVLFAALFFVMLAPWDWDNTKLMLWCYVLVLPVIADRLAALPRAVRVSTFALLFYSGAIAVAAACASTRAASIVDPAERAAVCAALSEIPAADRIATVQTFNHPVALCGHALVAGYGGHLWSHGIDAKAVEADLAALMRGDDGWEEKARGLGTRYIFWGPREEAAYRTSRRPWASFPVAAEGPWGRLYVLPLRPYSRRATTRTRAVSTSTPPARVTALGTSPNTA